MKRLLLVGLTLASFCGLAGPAAAQQKAPEGAKVFLLSGGQRGHHGYREQAFYLSEALENTGRFEVTIGEDAAILETPTMLKYDLLIVLADRRVPEFKFTTGQQEALFEFVRSGHGYVSIHGADNAAADWLPTWKEMLGGVFSHFGLPDGKTKKGSFTLKIADTSSPVTRGIEDFPIEDELYYQPPDDARRPAAGHHRIPGDRLAGRMDADVRSGSRLPHHDGASRLRARERRTRSATLTS